MLLVCIFLYRFGSPPTLSIAEAVRVDRVYEIGKTNPKTRLSEELLSFSLTFLLAQKRTPFPCPSHVHHIFLYIHYPTNTPKPQLLTSFNLSLSLSRRFQVLGFVLEVTFVFRMKLELLVSFVSSHISWSCRLCRL